MEKLFQRFMADRRGATVVEYALIVAFLSVVIAAAITSLGVRLYALIGVTTNAMH